jgi:uncharacterized protein
VTGNLRIRLERFRSSGELTSNRQLAEEQKNGNSDRLFPGEGCEVETAFGHCYLRELRFPLSHRHGNSTLNGVLSCCGSNLALPAREPRLEIFDPCRAIFLDIETTGLAGGTGTWAFLIGLGWVEKDCFLLRQYFLRRPAEEKAILSHFSAATAAYPTMITFNGKMFDLPLIQTRQLLAGLKLTEPELHLDLLHCARTLWRKRLQSRSLRSLEESLLGLRRHGDIPGAEIPAVYFEYLRRGKTERLKTVFHHNTLDILSMVTLLERVSLLGGGSGIEHPAEALSLGRLLISANRTAEGIPCLMKAANDFHPTLSVEASLELARYYKKEGNWAKAVTIWQKVKENEKTNPIAYVELAKYYEHRCRDYNTALDLAQRALGIAADIQGHWPGADLTVAALNHRIKRLENRCLKNTIAD